MVGFFYVVDDRKPDPVAFTKYRRIKEWNGRNVEQSANKRYGTTDLAKWDGL